MQALVTGGAQGIGLEIAESLISDGYNVSIFDTNEQKLKKISNKLNCQVFEIDISQESQVKEAIGHLESLDVLVNNAGIWRPELLENLDIPTQRSVWETNVLVTLICSK